MLWARSIVFICTPPAAKRTLMFSDHAHSFSITIFCAANNQRRNPEPSLWRAAQRSLFPLLWTWHRNCDPRSVETYCGLREYNKPFIMAGTWQGMPALTAFNNMTREYTNRKFTNEVDVLDAVAGVLILLKESILPEGFLFGLPLDHFRAATLWTQTSARPRR